MLQISAKKESSYSTDLTLRFGDQIIDDQNEKYLYEENDCTITNFEVSPDHCNGLGRLNPDSYLQKYAKLKRTSCPNTNSKSQKKKETGSNKQGNIYQQDLNDAKFVNYYSQPFYVSFSLRSSNIIFVME